MQLSSGKGTTTLLLVVLVAALLFAVFYYIILPKKEEAEILANSVNNLQTEITTLQSNIDDAKVTTTSMSDDFMLRKKVPATRAIDELILNIEEIEYLTESRILSIDFNNYDSLVSESGLAPKKEEEETSDSATEEENDSESTDKEEGTEADEVPTSSIDIESLPPSLKMVTFNIDVESPNNEKLQTFIKEVEKLDRIMHIDSISYSLPGEELEFEGTSEIISASIQVTTFFYE